MQIMLPIRNKSQNYHLKPSKILAVGLNYHTHIEENDKLNVRGFDAIIPTEPVIFPKSSNALTYHNMPILLPALIKDYSFSEERTDYEGELAVIIGTKCKNVSENDAMAMVLGYTIANDVSQRNIQNHDKSGWYRGKSFDTYLPMGPELVLKEDVENINNLRLVTRLNGKVVQDSNTSNMIFKIPKLISFLSKNFTL